MLAVVGAEAEPGAAAGRPVAQCPDTAALCMELRPEAFNMRQTEELGWSR